MSIAKGWDDLRLEVICQSNLVIAGSPRNAFRCSVPLVLSSGVKRLEGTRARKGTSPYQTQNTLDLRWGSENMGAKFHARKGNSPDRQLRSLSIV